VGARLSVAAERDHMQGDLPTFTNPHINLVQYRHEMVLPVAITTKIVVYKCAPLSHYLESVVD
jgi:hypothetical protein